MPVEPLTEPTTSPSVAPPDDGGAIRILPSPDISSSPHLLDKPTALCVTIHMDGLWMYNRWGVGMSESEKITINLGPVDLGQIDLLVQEGFYSNRTDFIRTAIRNQLSAHGEALKQAVVRKTLVLGLVEYTRADLEAVKKAGEKLRIQVLGLARIAPDVSAALAAATIESVTVLGAFQASPAVKAALRDRIH